MLHVTRWALCLIVACQLLACSSTSPTGGQLPGADSTALDDSPTARPDLVQQRIGPNLLVQAAWVPGTRQVAALMLATYPNCSLAMIDVDTRTINVLVENVAVCFAPGLCGFAVSPDAAALYYCDATDLTINGGANLIRRFNLSDHQITDVVAVPGMLQSFALSPDGRRLAYGFISVDTDHGLHLRDLTTGADTLLLESVESPAGNGVRFSPDGSQLVFDDAGRLHTFTLATGASAFIGGTVQAGAAYEWTASGIQYVAQLPSCTPVCIELTNATTGDRLGLFQDNTTMAYSADGLHAAGASRWCYDGPCARGRTEVAVADWPTHQATVIAREDCDQFPPGAMVVSPDDKSVIYSICSGTYLWTRP